MLKTAEFVYWGILALGVLFIVFQIIVPALTGTPFFPMLRPNARRNSCGC